MKRILFFVLAFFASSVAFSQEQYIGTAKGTVVVRGDLRTDSSAHVGRISVAPRLAFYLGTSITKGFSASDTIFRFSRLTSDYMSLTERNRGENGISLEGNINSALSKVPIYASDSMALITLEYGANDMLLIGTFGFTYANYIANYERLLDTVLARGWPAERVFLLATSYISQLPVLLQNNYNNGVDSLATVHGFTFVDIFNPTRKLGSPLLADQVHPNDPGNRVISQFLQSAIVKKIYNEAQRFTVDGLAEIIDLKYAVPAQPDSTLQTIGVNDAGHVRRFGYFDLIRNTRYRTPGNIWISDTVHSSFSILDKYSWHQEASLAPSTGTGLFAYFTGDRGYLEALNASTNSGKVLNLNGRYGGRIIMGSSAYTSPNSDALFPVAILVWTGALRIGPATNVNYGSDKAFIIEISGGGGNPAYIYARNYSTSQYMVVQTLSPWAYSSTGQVSARGSQLYVDGRLEASDTIISRGRLLLLNTSPGTAADSILVNTSTGVKTIPQSNFSPSDKTIVINTTGATPTVSGAISVLPGYISTITITMQAHNLANNEILVGRKIVSVKNISGTLTQLGSVQTIATDQAETSLSGSAWSATISGGALVIEVTGILATDIKWEAHYSITYSPLTFS